MTPPAASFGKRLRDHRESLGISLDAIAAETKINKAFLVELERDNVSKWPHGVFRRAFVKAYAEAIHLSPDVVLAEFSRHFPEDGVTPPDQPIPPPDPTTLRLNLADDPPARRPPIARAIAAAVDVGIVALIAFVAAAFARVDFWTACALAALPYYGVSSALLGRSPAGWCANVIEAEFAGRNAARVPETNAVRLRIVPRPLAEHGDDADEAVTVRSRSNIRVAAR